MTFTVPGGSISVEDLGDGRALVGDWECDTTNPHAAITLYKKAEKFCEDQNLQPVVTAETPEMVAFFLKMGLVPTSVVFTTRQFLQEF